MARLKVYTTTQGFHETAVAAPSQAKALEAWGTRQNLFAEGMARVTTEAAVVEAAMARPGEIVRRPAQSPAAIKAVMEAPRPEKASPARPAAKSKARTPESATAWTPAPKSRPRDRSRLDAAEAALAAFETRRRRAAESADAERKELEARLGREGARLQREEAKLTAAADKARTAYERD